MFVSAPRPKKNGVIINSTTLQANIAPTDSSPTTGFATEKEALERAQEINTNITQPMWTYGSRSNTQSGILGYKRYRNTDYETFLLRRTVVRRAVSLYQSTSHTRYRAESAPIGLGYSGGFDTGWQDNISDLIYPYGGSFDPIAIYNRTVIANAQRRGVVECKQKMLESKMDLAESLVDIDKSVLLVAERALQVLLAWQYARKGDWAHAMVTLGLTKRNLNFKNASEAWLELQYGWLPLLSDIFGAVEVVKEALTGDPLQHHTYAKRRVTEGLWIPKLSGNSDYWYNQSSSGVASVEVETKFRFRIADALAAYLAGFQLMNPLYMVWVGTPFTFVVDWILPIGDWLSSLTATFGLEFVDGYQSTVTSAAVTARGFRKPTYPAYWTLKASTQEAESRTEIGFMGRVAFTGWPMSYTYFRFPFTSPQRIASAIALTRVTAGRI